MCVCVCVGGGGWEGVRLRGVGGGELVKQRRRSSYCDMLCRWITLKLQYLRKALSQLNTHEYTEMKN